jgi:hypothetical protein
MGGIDNGQKLEKKKEEEKKGREYQADVSRIH